jgi:hypothetical protein
VLELDIRGQKAKLDSFVPFNIGENDQVVLVGSFRKDIFEAVVYKNQTNNHKANTYFFDWSDLLVFVTLAALFVKGVLVLCRTLKIMKATKLLRQDT